MAGAVSSIVPHGMTNKNATAGRDAKHRLPQGSKVTAQAQGARRVPGPRVDTLGVGALFGQPELLTVMTP
jgi:hypothetical protein